MQDDYDVILSIFSMYPCVLSDIFVGEYYRNDRY